MDKYINLKLKNKKNILKAAINLPASKSESNRVAMIQALCTKDINIQHLSTAADTKIMIRALKCKNTIINVKDAGTAMRFLTAFFCVTQQKKILIGTQDMYKRPIKILVNSLQTIGYNIQYLSLCGYPPIHILGKKNKKIKNKITVSAHQSSQYISALLIIAPALPQGLTIQLTPPIKSYPYIHMTMVIMKKFGIKIHKKYDKITIKSQHYKPPQSYTVEADWTSASYWYSFLALHPDPKSYIKLLRLKKNSLQGDKIIAQWMYPLGVQTTFNEDYVLIKKIPAQQGYSTINFQHHPDLAPTFMVLWAAKKMDITIKGIENLKIKESNRIQVMQNELAKIGTTLQEITKGIWQLKSSSKIWNKETIIINTYKDHRIAMAFAPLMMLGNITINKPTVVEKSYPKFWREVHGLQQE